MSIIETQQVWRTMSEGRNGSGYFVWDVVEVVGEPIAYFDLYTECRDGSYILFQCFHIWSEEKARQTLANTEKWESLHIIP